MTRHCQLLQIGQTVRVESVETGYRITVLTAQEAGPKVVEKGEDYIVLDDAQAEVQTRMPLHLISAVVAPTETMVAAA